MSGINKSAENFFKAFLDNAVKMEESKKADKNNDELGYYDVLIKEFYNTDNMELKSNITEKQSLVLTLCKIYAEEFNLPIVDNMLSYLLKIRVSIKGEGRKGFDEIFKFANNKLSLEQDPYSKIAKVRGGNRGFE